MSRFLAFATLTTLVATPCIGSQQLDELLSRAERATTTKERVELWDGVDPKMGELTTVVEQALGSSNERVRIFGAMLLSKVGDEAAYGKQSSRAVNDKSLEVRRIAWLTKLVRRKSLSPDEIRTLQREHDLVLHTTAVVALDDNRQLSELAVTAESRFLRAAAVRRLAMAWPKGGDEAIAAEAALDRALTSNDPLLRTSALLSARRVGYLPVSTLRGITFDSRPMLSIDCLLDVSPEAQRLREQYGLAGEYVWSLSLLKME